MSQVAVCEGVGSCLKPDYDGVDFGSGTNQWMVNMIVDNIRGKSQAKRRIHSVQPDDQFPCGVEFPLFFRRGRRCVSAGSRSTARSAGNFLTRSLFGGYELDYIGDEEVARNAEEKSHSEKEVLSAVVVAADTY